MSQRMEQSAEKRVQRSRRHKYWKRAVMAVAGIVVLATVGALTLPAITMEKRPICGLEEHIHTDACYSEVKTLVCPLEESEEHKHTEECYKIEKVLICGKGEHVHNEDCYEKSDDTADVETKADWDASAAVELSGDWAKDLVAVARTQLGYTESSRNFRWNQDGNKDGYSRYGAWAGKAYDPWSAEFAAFCVNYAKIPAEAMPVEAASLSWSKHLMGLQRYQTPASYTPKMGDLVFFDTDKNNVIDHMGIVSSVETADGRAVTVTAIEGDADRKVQELSYKADSTAIMGYGLLKTEEKPAPEDAPAEGEPAPEEAAPGEVEDTTVRYEGDALSVTVILKGLTEAIPEGAALEVTPVEGEAYTQALDRLSEAALDRTHEMGALTLFDMQLTHEGQPVQAAQEADAQVSVSFKKPLFTNENVKQADEVKTYVMDAGAPQKAEPRSEVRGVYGGMEKGMTDLSYEAKGVAPFAVMLTNQTQQGKFWKLCRNINSGEEFKTDANYLIVSAEGNYALTNNLNGGLNRSSVQLQPVKGNPDYYTIDNVPQKAIWKYNYNLLGGGTRSFYQGTKSLFGGIRGTFVNPGLNGLFGQQEINLGFGKSNCPACFNLYNGSYYLNYNDDEGVQTFLTSSSQTIFSNQNLFQYVKTSDMLILQQVDATLTIPDDVVADVNGDRPGIANKPDYPAYIAPSGEKTGSYESTQGHVDYASDPATTQLEKYFGNHPLNGKTDYEAQKGDNGKALMDKSVIYGHDDYGAIPQYEDGTFGVTLSALGQAFVVDQSVTKVPMDVLLILDMSNSMNETDSGQKVSRAQILVDSINKTMNNIMKANPENRVCAVGYNSGAYDLLQLGHHWKGEGGKYFKYTPTGYNQWNEPSGQIQATGLSGVFGSPVPCTNGTFTQMGIAQGYDLLMRNTPNPEDTTYTTTVNGQTVTRPRKPVIILVSDGEPTHCTSHYMDVLRNPYYGDGLAPVSNGKGVQGYYTILSANYYKRMIGIHYNNPATMYTVAFGMKEGDYTQVDGSAASNHYRATVMNPTQANIEELLKVKNTDSVRVEQYLYHLLKGDYTDKPLTTGGHFNFDALNKRLGNPHGYVPVLKNNPYRGNYAYADKAYLNNSGNNGLDAAFEDIVKLNTVYDFSYETQADKPLTLTDPIGDGMEVKGAPVLRVNGKNYQPAGNQTQGNATVYTYSGVVPMDPYTGRTVDLSTIKVKVETVNGKQNVTMEIPPKSLPTYTADNTMSFYHEALPIRLTYKVGLSADGQAQIDSLRPGETRTFYTNRYTGGDHAGGTLDPSVKNPYYKSRGWQLTNQKTSNPTGTAKTSLVKTGSASHVDYNLGNNGRLTITRKEDPVKPVSVWKKWQDYDGTDKTEGLPAQITATLYRTYLENGKEVREDVVKDFTLSAENGWKRTFTPQELKAVPGREYRYYVTEQAIEGYKVTYEGDGIVSNTPESPITMTNRYQFGDFILPESGGPGTTVFTLCGTLVITAGALCWYALRKKERERRKNNTQ